MNVRLWLCSIRVDLDWIDRTNGPALGFDYSTWLCHEVVGVVLLAAAGGTMCSGTTVSYSVRELVVFL